MSKGRSKKLIEKRNAALIERWNYWTDVQRLRFDDALNVLSQTEFFISGERVMSIIRAYNKSEQPAKRLTTPKVKVAKPKRIDFFSDESTTKKP
jgi:hypothetical protein